MAEQSAAPSAKPTVVAQLSEGLSGSKWPQADRPAHSPDRGQRPFTARFD